MCRSICWVKENEVAFYLQIVHSVLFGELQTGWKSQRCISPEYFWFLRRAQCCLLLETFGVRQHTECSTQRVASRENYVVMSRLLPSFAAQSLAPQFRQYPPDRHVLQVMFDLKQSVTCPTALWKWVLRLFERGGTCSAYVVVLNPACLYEGQWQQIASGGSRSCNCWRSRWYEAGGI